MLKDQHPEKGKNLLEDLLAGKKVKNSCIDVFVRKEAPKIPESMKLKNFKNFQGKFEKKCSKNRVFLLEKFKFFGLNCEIFKFFKAHGYELKNAKHHSRMMKKDQPMFSIKEIFHALIWASGEINGVFLEDPLWLKNTLEKTITETERNSMVTSLEAEAHNCKVFWMLKKPMKYRARNSVVMSFVKSPKKFHLQPYTPPIYPPLLPKKFN